MPFTKELPEWGNAGQRPPQSSIDEGYKPMDHPPADWFNWYQYTAYHALKELQEIGATQDDVSTALKTAKAYTDEYAARRDNPNQVTKGQVGLGNVDNVQQATKAEFNAHNTDSTRHITSTERSNWNAKETTTGAQNKADTAEKNAKTYTDQHINDKSNPHGVTKAQVGLGNVDNVQQASLAEFRQHNFNQERHVSQAEKDKWNSAQLYKLTQDNGQLFYKSSSETTDFNEMTATGMYLIYNAGVNGPGLTKCFLLVMSYENTLIQSAYDASNGLRSFYRIRKNDSTTWTTWRTIMTAEDLQERTFVDTYDLDNTSLIAEDNIDTRLRFGKIRADKLSEYNQSLSEITLKSDGLYLIRLYVNGNDLPINASIRFSCYVNGSLYQVVSYWYPSTSANTYVDFLQQKFNAGDKVSFYITPQHTGKAISVSRAFVTMSKIN